MSSAQGVASTNSFAVELYKAVSKGNPNSNVFLSPISVEVVLAMAFNGAQGETAKELANVLGLPTDEKALLRHYKNLMDSIKSPDLQLATKLFIDDKFRLKPNFTSAVTKGFGSDVQSVPFHNNPSDAKKKINSWVEKQTNNKIKDIIEDGVLTPETVLVLVNAIYFLSDWQTKFVEHSTRKDKFYVSEGKTIDVDMMFVSDRFNYYESSYLNAKILELPYKGHAYSMFIILPDKIEGLSEMEQKLNADKLAEELAKVSSHKVSVSMPKFKLTTMMDLNDILKSMGLSHMFSDKADFSEMSDIPVKVSKIIQKAFIDVNENGTEAAAATGNLSLSGDIGFNWHQQHTDATDMSSVIAAVVRMRRAIQEDLEYFEANHPFLFFIIDKASESILFSGCFADYSSADSVTDVHEEL